MVHSVPAARYHLSPAQSLHAFLLGGATCFLASAFLSDWAYYASLEIQWKNFSSWLIIGGLIFAGFTMLWALADTFRKPDRKRRIIYVVLLLAAWIVSFINELVHAKDAWGSMPEALILSGIAAALIIGATCFSLTLGGAGR